VKRAVLAGFMLSFAAPTIHLPPGSSWCQRTLVKQQNMKKKKSSILIVALLSLLALTLVSANGYRAEATPIAADTTTVSRPTDSLTGNWHLVLYHQLLLDSMGLNQKAYELALKGWEKLQAAGTVAGNSLLTIADFSQPSAKKRLYVIDMLSGKLLFNTYVAHGRGSGKDQAKKYSNRPSSNMSSPGFYRTADTYYGSNGYSLRLEGLEKGINDNADRRAIVMHGADYVNESFARTQGYIGRSLGCPAIPLNMTRPIINTIKEGSCLFIYSPQVAYASRSRLLQ